MYKKLISYIDFNKVYLYSLLFFAFMLPLSTASNSLFSVFMILLLILQGNYKKHFLLLKKENIIIFMTTFVAFMSLSILWTEDLKVGFDELRHFIVWIAIFAMALNLKLEQIYKIMTAFIFGMLVSEILSYGMFFELWEIKGRGSDYPSPIMSHETYGFFLAFTAIILFNRMMAARYTMREKMLYAVFFTSILGNLFINTGRMGQLVFIIGVFTSIIIHYRVTFKSIFLAFSLVLIIFTLAFNTIEHFKVRVLQGKNDLSMALKGNYNTSWGNRVVYHLVAKEILTEHYLVGVGIGDYKQAMRDVFEKEGYGVPEKRQAQMAKNHFHNQYLNVAVQTGVIGLVLLLLVLYNYMKMDIKDRELKELSILFIMMFSAASYSSLYLGKSFGTSIFILFSGLFIAALVNNKDQSNSSKDSL